MAVRRCRGYLPYRTAFRADSRGGPAVAGEPSAVTLNVLDAFGNPVPGYTGTVQFTSTDPTATSTIGPNSEHAFTETDNGSFAFDATFLTSGTQTISVTGPNGLNAQGTVAVTPAAASIFGVSDSAADVMAGGSWRDLVTAYDAFGNVVTGYTGTIHFASTDAQATLPAYYTFTTGNETRGYDNGIHVFSTTFDTSGVQKLAVADGAASPAVGDGSLDVVASGVNLFAKYDLCLGGACCYHRHADRCDSDRPRRVWQSANYRRSQCRVRTRRCRRRCWCGHI